MKMATFRHLFAALGTALAVLAAAPADAQDRDRRQPSREQARPMPPPGKQFERAERRDDREKGGDRLSPEERRKLREDINQHGREIYRDRERGRGR
jgi:hypothetical protein